MVPVQALDDANKETKPYIAIKPKPKEVNGVEEEVGTAVGLACLRNCEDGAFRLDAMFDCKKLDDVMDLEIDIVGCEESGAVELGQADDPDATEHSSSFGDTFLGSDEELRMNLSDAEVESRWSGDDGYDGVFRKKRLTSHWRRFIRPLMWRCHWIELRMKELRAQALRYDKELAMYMQEKQLHSEMVESDRTVSRLIPLTFRNRRNQAMKRRKCKRREDIADVSSSMSHHNIFSYYENKRSETGGHSVDDDCSDEVTAGPGNFGANSERPMLGSRGGDSALEQILLAIESLQSRVLNLKTHLTKVTSKNTKEISLTQGDFVHVEPPFSSAPLSPCCSPPNNGNAMPVGALDVSPHHSSDTEDPFMTGSSVSSYGDAVEVNIFKGTLGLLSSADAHPDWHDTEYFCKDNVDDVLINNQAAEEELQNFEVSHTMEKPHEVAEEEVESSFEDESTAPEVLMYEVGLSREQVDVPRQQQPVMEPCYSGKRRGRKPKRKRRGRPVIGSGKLESEKCQKQSRFAR